MKSLNFPPESQTADGQFAAAMHAFFQTASWILVRWRTTLLLPILAGIVAYSLTLLVAPRYRAESTFLIDAGSDNSGMGLKALAGGDLGSLLGGKMTGKEEIPLLEILMKGNDLGMSMLKDTGIRSEWELDKQKLLIENELQAWHDKFRYVITEDGAVILKFESKSPQRAVRMVEKVFLWLDSAETSIKQARASKKFSASQEILSKREILLQESEDSLMAFQLRNRVYAPSEQLSASIQELAALEVEKEKTDVMRQLSIEEDGLSSTKAQKLAGLQREIERKLAESSNKSGLVTMAPKDALPKMLEFTRRLKKVHVHAAVITLLTQQIEQYRLELTKTVSPVYQVEAPMLPQKRSSPPRLAIAQAASIIVFVLSVLLELGIANYRIWLVARRGSEVQGISKPI